MAVSARKSSVISGPPAKRAVPKKQNQRAPLGLRALISILVNAGRIVYTAILVMVITGCIVASVLTIYITQYIKSDNDVVDLRNITLNYTSIIYAQDKDTNDFYELQRIHGRENRIWVDIDRMPLHLQHALVALEDKRFYQHDGVDWLRTVGAFAGLFGLSGSGTTTGGGSTITQQLIKNITGNDAVRVDRKIKEIFSALALSKQFSRDEILEAYLNTIALGNNTNGVQAAANLYFNKDVSELTIAESAAIVSITKYPTYYDPFINPENNKNQRNYALWCMFDQGYITESEYNQAINEELEFKRTESIQKLNTANDWFTDYVIESVIEDLMEQKGYSYAEAESALFRGGYQIYTTVDTELQQYLNENFLVGNAAFPTITNKEYPEGAFVILDANGKILALAGSNREKTGDRIFNRAVSAQRHPGSTMKPISAYLQGIETNLITWSTVIEDGPIQYKNMPQYPKNYYAGYLGNMTVDEALRRSTNTIPVKIIQTITPQRSFDFLKNKLKIDSLVAPTDIDLGPMALGGMTKGVTPLELAGAYQIYANGGYFTKPYCYTKVLDGSGKVILEKDTTPVRVVSYETATIINKLMQRVTSAPLGTGTNANLGTMPVAGKTGTSSDDKDQWFVGITPYYIGVVWLGYDQPQQIRYTSQPYPPPILWKNIMKPLHADLEPVKFSESSNVVGMRYCTVSGDIATDMCPTTDMGYYKSSYFPGTCTLHLNASDSSDITGSWDDDWGSGWGSESSGGRIPGYPYWD